MNGSFQNRQKAFWENKQRKQRRSPTHPAIAGFVESKINYIKAHIPKTSALTLLEVGAGNGFFSYYLEKDFKYLLSTDYSEAMLEQNPARNKQLEDATRLTLEEGSFDAVFCSNLLHHIQTPQLVVNEMARVSNRYVILHEPNRNNPLMLLFGLMKKEEHQAIYFSKKYLENLVQKAGLTLVHSMTIGSILPNKTPKVLIPLLKVFDSFPCTFYNMVIATKEEYSSRDGS